MESRPVPPWERGNRNAQPSNPRKRPAPSSDAQEDAWVAEEDQFVLRQAKRKAALRVKAKRPKPIDWLAVTLSVIDPTRDSRDEDEDGADLEMADPEGILESLNEEQLEELQKDIETYLTLEHHPTNKEYWQVCSRQTGLYVLLCADTYEILDHEVDMQRTLEQFRLVLIDNTWHQ